MALTQRQRAQLIGTLVTNGWDEDKLDDLTDNQLVALDRPDELDELVTNVFEHTSNADEEDEELDGDEEEDDEEEDEPTPKKKATAPKFGKNKPTMNEFCDDELAAEMKKRKSKKPTGNSQRAPREDSPNGQLSVNQYINMLTEQGAPQEVLDMITNAQVMQDIERAELIEVITSNEANDFTKSELKSTALPTLRRLSRLAQTTARRPGYGRSDYTANAGGGSLVGNGSSETPLDTPDLGWGSSE